MSRPLALLTLAVAFAAPAAAQDDGRFEGIRFGHAVLGLGDLDGDGLRELAVGAPAADGAAPRAGLVLVLSGADRRVLQQWRGQERRVLFGDSLREAGDVDGDGTSDVLVGYEFGARTEVRSGVDGALLLGFDRAADDVLALGDADGDGHDDLLLVAGRRFEVRSGVDGRLLAGTTVYDDGRALPVGDVDGDGLVDVILQGDEQQVLWRSGVEPGVDLRERRPFHPQRRAALAELWPDAFAGGDARVVSAASAGDLDGDGAADLWLALARDDERVVLGVSPDEPAPLVRIEVEPGLGRTCTGVDDLDGDGVRDVLLTEEPVAFRVRVQAHSGADGRRLWRGDWGDRGMTAVPRVAVLPSDAPGVAPKVLVGSADSRWHGDIFRIGLVRLVDGATGEELWDLPVEDLPPLGAADDDGAIDR